MVCWQCQKEGGLRGGISLFKYRPKTSQLLHNFKYERQLQEIKIIKQMIMWWWKEVGKQLEIIKYWKKKNFKLSYVPISKRRKGWRGFNQAQLIAKVVSRVTGLKVWEGMERVKNTPPRVGLSKKERWLSVRGCFGIKEKSKNVDGVVVVDDVITTGATLKEIARVLKRGGVGEVWFLSLLKT